ncbi:dihydroorotase [Helicobacter vulpis]|uniref:dihydroorotase n=1 Tax=Helicobacter vulpis TaxID=2316076 RepID=UPI000EAB798B|nr:dihydroorotase [Helicobacter vulpis]
MFTLHNPLDMHLHLREGEMLAKVLPFSARAFSAAVVMPNLQEPINTTARALDYARQIQAQSTEFMPLVALYLQESLSPQELENARRNGLFLIKLYPQNVTTNSTQGVADILSPKILEILRAAQDLDFILCVHAETQDFVLDREVGFHPILESLCARFPQLPIILEHMSDARSIPLLEKYPNLYATLTLHHITWHLDALLGARLNPHLFCKPLLKTPKDQEALLQLALSAHPKVCFGSDSAPHSLAHKHACACAAGIFSAPLLLEALTTLFDIHHALDRLQAFVSDNARRIYQLDRRVQLPKKSLTLSKHPPTIPTIPDLIIPPFAVEWRIDA